VYAAELAVQEMEKEEDKIKVIIRINSMDLATR
jgi:hypothetical protein